MVAVPGVCLAGERENSVSRDARRRLGVVGQTVGSPTRASSGTSSGAGSQADSGCSPTEKQSVPLALEVPATDAAAVSAASTSDGELRTARAIAPMRKVPRRRRSKQRPSTTMAWAILSGPLVDQSAGIATGVGATAASGSSAAEGTAPLNRWGSMAARVEMRGCLGELVDAMHESCEALKGLVKVWAMRWCGAPAHIHSNTSMQTFRQCFLFVAGEMADIGDEASRRGRKSHLSWPFVAGGEAYNS